MAKQRTPTLILVSGVGAEVYDDQETFAWLRRLDRRGVDIGALCTASHLLARAGLLDGRVCTLHWENIPSFRETYPDIEVTDDLFEIDGNRFTCSGGTAALDLMLHLIRAEHGEELANRVSEECILDRVRGGHDHQRMPLAIRLGVDNRKLIDSIHMMETNLEEPALPRWSSRRPSVFPAASWSGCSIGTWGDLPTAIICSCASTGRASFCCKPTWPSSTWRWPAGFVSASHFAKCYRQFYGLTPRQARVSGP